MTALTLDETRTDSHRILDEVEKVIVGKRPYWSRSCSGCSPADTC